MAQGPAMTATCWPPMRGAVGKLDDRAFGAKGAAGQLVGRADAVNVEHAGQHFKLCEVEAGGGADAGENGLHGSGGAMHVDAHFFHGDDDGIDLFFGGFLLHCDNHCLFPVSDALGVPRRSVAGFAASAAWPCSLPSDWAAWAFFSEANSFLCNARITSMMRS